MNQETVQQSSVLYDEFFSHLYRSTYDGQINLYHVGTNLMFNLRDLHAYAIEDKEDQAIKYLKDSLVQEIASKHGLRHYPNSIGTRGFAYNTNGTAPEDLPLEDRLAALKSLCLAVEEYANQIRSSDFKDVTKIAKAAFQPTESAAESVDELVKKLVRD